MVGAARAAGHPHDLPRHRHRHRALVNDSVRSSNRAALGASRSLGARVRSPGEIILGRTSPELFFGINGGLILVSVAVAAIGIGVAIWLFGIFNGRRPPRRPSPSLTDRNRVSRFLYLASLATSGGSMTSTASSSTASAAAIANGRDVVRRPKVIDGIVNGVGDVAAVRGAPASARSRPAACRTTRSASPSGSSSSPDPLRPDGPLMGSLDLGFACSSSAHHLHAGRRRLDPALRSRQARPRDPLLRISAWRRSRSCSRSSWPSASTTSPPIGFQFVEEVVDRRSSASSTRSVSTASRSCWCC